jgi:DNA segregation ATPase FtsK/SpoIIIE-like protein
MDELLKKAAIIIIESQQGSTSLIQRKLKVDYEVAEYLMNKVAPTRIELISKV